MSTVDVAVGRERGADREAGLALVGAAAAVMWLSEIADQLGDLDLDRYGILPRAGEGLDGVLWAPLLHSDFSHLVGNTIPFLLFGAAIALSGLARVAAVTAIVWVVGGLGTWAVAPEGTVHIGASGIVFGYAAYLVARGVLSRQILHVAAAVLVAAAYGTTLLQGLVPEDGVSWQGHLFGAVGGAVAAWSLHAARPQRRAAT